MDHLTEFVAAVVGVVIKEGIVYVVDERYHLIGKREVKNAADKILPSRKCGKCKVKIRGGNKND